MRNFNWVFVMKKIFILVSTCLYLVLFTGCFSASLLFKVLGPPNGYNSYKGSSNPFYGYEGFSWGTTRDDFVKKTGWQLASCGRNGFVVGHENGFLGYEYYPHGNKDLYVDKTILYFDEVSFYDQNEGNFKTVKSRLYAAEDEYKKTPSISFLHSRYGPFSEENVVTYEQKFEGVKIVYKSQPYIAVEDFSGLEILIYKNGKTKVKLKGPFIEKSMQEERQNANNKWICYSAVKTQFKNEVLKDSRIEFTFLNQNEDGKCLFVGYSKGYNNPNISYVRAGICWDKDAKKTIGNYDIKGVTGPKKYSTDEWQSEFDNKTYVFTSNVEDGARELLNLFANSESVLVRHNDDTVEFNSKYKSLLEKMAEFGITWEELDSAMANEEF